LPIATAKQELLLRVLACDPVIDEVLKRIDLRLVGLLDYSEIEGAVTDLHEWRREGKASEGRRWRQAVSALNAIDLPSKFIKDIVEELWMPFSDNPISLSNLYEQIAELEASVKRVTSEYLPLVRRFASRNTGEDEELEDVFQVSYIGLHRAAHRFDPEIGERFSTYAIYGMQQSLNRWRGDEGRTIRLPIHRHDSVILFDQAFSKLEATYCRAPTVSELAIALGWDQKEVQKIMSIARLGIHPESLEEWDDLYDYSDTESTTELTRERTELSQVISSILSELDDREADVIRRRYGINLDEEMTLQEIGDIYGLTRERIRQVEAKAMKKLSHPARVRRITKSLGIY
jgi:RNA polymerase primary sigma factor